jgi:hypothetical protein
MLKDPRLYFPACRLRNDEDKKQIKAILLSVLFADPKLFFIRHTVNTGSGTPGHQNGL